MRATAVSLLLALLAPAVVAQAPRVGPSPLAALVGAGNSFSGVGVLVDYRPLRRGPLSVIASLGSAAAYYEDAPDVAGAIGIRATVGKSRNQVFLEAAFLPVAHDVVSVSADYRLALLYGLGLQLGYRFVTTKGISFNALGGAGYAVRSGVVASPLKPLIGIGLGYAWAAH